MFEEDSGVDTLEDDNEWAVPLNEQPSSSCTSRVVNMKAPQKSKQIKRDITDTHFYISKLKHSRTIIHIDIDCFYAQVEIIRNPQLRGKPLGIQQKYIVVTCNYTAREYGVTKLMTIKDAKEKCPQLILVNGEDLTHYREMSYKISEFLQKYTPNVERLGFDENFLDVSEIVKQRIDSGNHGTKVIGHTYMTEYEEGQQTSLCDCGCTERITVGSELADDIRSSLYDELGVTCCAGISYNKLLAKLVGEQHKPNQQTTLFPSHTHMFMSSMQKASKIPGVGWTMSKKLARLGIVSVTNLQEVPLSDLVPEIGETQAVTIKQLSCGVDDSPVVPFGRPQTLSNEDSFKNCCTVSAVKSKALQLLTSLLQRLKDDGRIVQTLRLSIRKLTADNKWTNRESRQCPIPHHIALKITQGRTDGILQELEKMTMGLFTKLIDINIPFHLTLMNIAFCKLVEKPKNSIQNFLSPKKSETFSNNVDKESVKNESQNILKNTKTMTKQRISDFFKSQDPMQIKGTVQIPTGHQKKRKIEDNFSEKGTKKTKFEEISSEHGFTNEHYLHSVDKEVFYQLPADIQKEIVQHNSTTEDTLAAYQKTMGSAENHDSVHHSETISKPESHECFKDEVLYRKLRTAGIDITDFPKLPPDVQKDILEQLKIPVKQKSNTPQQNKKSILNYFTAK